MAGSFEVLSDWGYWGDDDPQRRQLVPLEEFPRDTWRGPVYQPTKEILRVRNAPFRDGFPKDFSAILGFASSSQIMTAQSATQLSSSDDVRNDYLVGLMVGSIIILAIFIIWCAVLILLKCCGRKRVGCASGVPRKPPPRPVPPRAPSGVNLGNGAIELDEKEGFQSETKASSGEDNAAFEDEYQQALVKYDRQRRKFDRTILLTRVSFLLAGIFVIVGSILFYVQGIGSLINSLKSVQGTLTYSDEVLTDATRVLDDYIDSSSQLRESREKLQSELDANCTSISLPPGNGLEDVRNALKNVRSGLDDLSKGIESVAGDVRTDLVEVQNSVNNLNSGLDNAYPFLYSAIAISIVLIIITLLLMWSVVLAWKKRKIRNCCVQCLKNGVIIPIFIFFMLLAWLFATLFLFAAIGGSDFCAKPDENTIAALQYIQMTSVQNEEDAGNIIFNLLKFYVSGCDEALTPKPEAWEQEIVLLETVVNAVHDLVFYFTTEDALLAVQTLCGGTEGGNLFASLNTAAIVLHDRLHILWTSFIAVYGVISCKTMNPLYTRVAHDGMCVNAVTGLVWIFSTQLCIAICCMIMVTLRAAAQEIEEDVEAEQNASLAAVGKNILVPSVSVDVAEVSPNPTAGSGEAEIGVEQAVGYEEKSA